MKKFAAGLKLPLFVAAALLANSPSAWARGGGGGHGGGHFGGFVGARRPAASIMVPRAPPTNPPVGIKPIGATHGGGRSSPGVVIWGARYFVPASDASWWVPVPLDGPDQWTETNFDVRAYGRNLALEVHGDAAIAWAEIVFHDGTSEVVDFENRVAQTGVYRMLELDDVRLVDHVRVMARGLTDGASLDIAVQQ